MKENPNTFRTLTLPVIFIYWNGKCYILLVTVETRRGAFFSSEGCRDRSTPAEKRTGEAPQGDFPEETRTFVRGKEWSEHQEVTKPHFLQAKRRSSCRAFFYSAIRSHRLKNG